MEERPIGDIFWNGVPNEKMGDEEIQIGEDVYNISNDIPKRLHRYSGQLDKKTG